ncbi:centrosomal protein of 78 kDa isoform X1 [Zootermopsis nevadensis]|uniref:centrosomal protein of 78 kDa isoform X1 n=1 Tax=Zootermopsis nevadensis TaxID=136037 RepID=UPI000B8E8902|nr:centrosomal protein of 78 kDa isoform X1 [Zootermopsis nevadensis]XP_021921178.1 centrosomal protein of 78 kDa isoform X1 [Zootermopsis nevadensis]
MMQSVRERKENSRKFSLCYEDLCRIQNQRPLPSVKAHLEKNILNFNGDLITCEEWGPILNALALDRSLHFIAVHSRLCAKPAIENIVTESRSRTLQRVPVLQTHFVLLRLLKAIEVCMSNTEVLTCVELEGLPIGRHYLEEFIKGMRSCKSLKHVSLHRSPIRDEGCALLCHAIKGLTNIITVNFSNCGLTHQGALAVAKTIEYQKIQRCSETWKQTLRYHEPNLDSVPGLRRITLNHNTEIRDEGAVYLMNAARDDLFLKALDLQDCGIGNTGGRAALEMLQSNVSLAVVDLRANKALSSGLLTQIMEQLHVNSRGAPQQYHWITVGENQLPQHHPRPKSQPLFKKTASLKLDSRSMTAPKRGHAPHTAQNQELYHTAPPATPYRMELEKARQQLSAETLKSRQMEEENAALRHRLEGLLGDDYVLVERQTLAVIQQLFQKFIETVHDTRPSGLQDADHEECLVSLHRQLYNTCDKSSQTDLHKIFKSVAELGDVGPVQDVEMDAKDCASVRVLQTCGSGVVSSEGTVSTLTQQECSLDSVMASGEDSDASLPQDCLELAEGTSGKAVHRTPAKIKDYTHRRMKQRNKCLDETYDILYQTVLSKNKELNSAGVSHVCRASKKRDAPADKGSTTSSSSSVITVPEDTGAQVLLSRHDAVTNNLFY